MPNRLFLALWMVIAACASSTPQTALFSGRSVAATTIAVDFIGGGFGATCNGVADDGTAFDAFNTWLLANQGTSQVILTITSGRTCCWTAPGTHGNNWVFGAKNLIVSGYGATFSGCGGTGAPFFGGSGIIQDNLTNALVQTVSAGSMTVTLVTAAQASRFTVGRPTVLTGGSLQDGGYPPNPHTFEYITPSNINAGTGVVTFTTPLQYSYKSTWPSTSSTDTWQGGPATLYALPANWDTQVEYRGLTLNFSDPVYAAGRSITYTDVTVLGTNCVIPSGNGTWTMANGTMSNCGIEVDKMIDHLVFTGGTIRVLLNQSRSSANRMDLTNFTATTGVNGTTRNAVITGSTIASLTVGVQYGATDSVTCTNSSIGAVVAGGGNDVLTGLTMSGGTITASRAGNAQAWAVPNTWHFWRTGNYDYAKIFKVLDNTSNGANQDITTDQSGTFPFTPTDRIIGHPSPVMTFTNCTGSADAVDLSQAGAQGKPFGSYTKRTYVGVPQTSPTIPIIGTLAQINVAVNTAYTGAQSTLTFELIAGGMNTVNPNLTFTCGCPSTFYDPTFNAKITGTRVIKSDGTVTGTQSGDANLAEPVALWSAVRIAPVFSQNIGSEGAGTRPSISIEITTDQGIP